MLAGGTLALAVAIGVAVTRGEEPTTASVPVDAQTQSDPEPDPKPVPKPDPKPDPKPVPVRTVEPPVSNLDPDLVLAEKWLAQKSLRDAERLLAGKSPKDPAVLALLAKLNDAKANVALDAARNSANKGRYGDVKTRVDDVRRLANDRTLVAAADKLWADLKPDVIKAVKTKVTALSRQAECEAAREEAKLGQDLGENYDALFRDCALRRDRARSEKATIERLLREIETTTMPNVVETKCVLMTSWDKDRARVPWFRCVQAACSLGRGQAMILLAPMKLRLGLAQMCPNKN